MKSAKFKYLRVVAIGLALTISLMQSVNGKRIIGPASSAATFDNPDLNSESRTVNSFNDDLSNFDKKRVQLSKRSAITSEEFNSLERTGNDLKRRISQLKDATESIIRKLKASGRWDNLDEEILAKLTDSKDRAFVQDNGGLRRAFETALTDLNSQSGDEIVAPLSNLRSKVAAGTPGFHFNRTSSSSTSWRIVAVNYSAPSLMKTRSLRCIGATIRYGVGLVLHGPGTGSGPKTTIPTETVDSYKCQCHDVCANQIE